MVKIRSYPRVTPMVIGELPKGTCMVYGVKEPKQTGFVKDCGSYFGTYHEIPEDMRGGSGYIVSIKNSRGIYKPANAIIKELEKFFHFAEIKSEATFYVTRVGFELDSPYKADDFKHILKKLSKLENVFLPVSAWTAIEGLENGEEEN